jgi:hypothetical protein
MVFPATVKLKRSKGWVLYHLVIKRKNWDSIQADALTCLVFAGVWILIAYMLTNQMLEPENILLHLPKTNMVQYT